MHWMLDVHWSEDFCRVEDRDVQQNLNMVRKIALNSMKLYKESTGTKLPVSRMMLDCLVDCENLLPVLSITELSET